MEPNHLLLFPIPYFLSIPFSFFPAMRFPLHFANKCCCLVTTLLALLLLIATSGGGGAMGGLPLHLIAVFPKDHAPALSRALRKAASDVDSGMVEKDITIVATPFIAPNNSHELVACLCDTLDAHNPSAILSFVDKPQAFFASLVSGYVRIPIFELARGYTDEASMDMNPYYISLDPNPSELANSIFLFLETNEWLHSSVIRDDSKFAMTFSRQLMAHAKESPWDKIIREMEVRNDQSDTDIFNVISDVPRYYARVLLLLCEGELAVRVFQEARRANLLSGDWIWIVIEKALSTERKQLVRYPTGILGVKLRLHALNRHAVRNVVELFAESIADIDVQKWSRESKNFSTGMSCWFNPNEQRNKFSQVIHRSAQQLINSVHRLPSPPKPHEQKGLIFPTVFDIYNLLPGTSGLLGSHHNRSHWKLIGNITSSAVAMDTVFWLTQNRIGPPSVGRQRFRIVTAFAPPFIKPSTRVGNGSCLLGIPCLQVHTNSKDDLARIFADYASGRSEGVTYNVTCCAGIAIDLMRAIARDLMFDFDLYLVADGVFGTNRGPKWNGVTADLMTGAAHMAFTAFSMTSMRSKVIDFSVPFFHSGVSCLTYMQERDVPLSAFLVPFSVQLWVAIFASLNATAVCAAIYEWLSPFGLNPWGRMRSKNFSLASALWVMWSLLFSHLVAFKAPKSWPNKVLINLWGCFSVIFVSSYTANIAAHFAGLFFHLRVEDFRDASLLNQRTGTAKSSAAEGYVFAENPELWQHIQNYGVANLEDGLDKLRKGDLDVLIGDTVLLDYYRGNDPGCGLHLLGTSIFDDAYAVGMQKGFPLKDAISTLVLRYNAHGFVEQLQKKWYGRVPCFNHSVHRLNKPKPLSIGAVAGVFVMLVVGLLVGIVILVMEHMVFKHALPVLRKKPAESFWKSPNLMFFSQKLYRFINTVELVSPHHSAKEIVTNLREGQIFSLFQKSVKRKAKEEARRRKSKSQFFEMIQEIRNVVRQQQQQRRLPGIEESLQEPGTQQLLSPGVSSPSEDKQLLLGSQKPNIGAIGESSSDWAYHSLTSRRFEALSSSPAIPTHSGIHLRNSLDSRIPDRYRRSLAGSGIHGFGHNRYSHLSESYFVNNLVSDNDLDQGSCSSSRSPTVSSEDYPNFRTGLNAATISISVDDLRLLNNSHDSRGESPTPQKPRKFLSMEDVVCLKKKKMALTVEAMREGRARSRGSFSLGKAAKGFRQISEEIDELLLYSMSKEEIIRKWQASERKLLNKLRDTLREKRSLEEKLAFIQKTLVKPP